ncbi:DNA-binding IclR family transcriptional regulator [Rhodoligotrophos appendicifer]|uniref:IclR family transcriptional regulator n=1 Tax=Rhodoligotrophos appendicifer TaxID=987056 RepID=UPI001478FF90|nr:IclR family transcriptional regulator [Rhodoligotrophos appendicifer]
MNVRAVTRAIAILKSFEGRGLQGLAEIAAQTGLDKGTTRRLLVTLMNSGFIAQDAATQRYGLGRAIRALAESVIDNFDLRAAAVPVMEQLAAELDVTTFLSIYQNGAAICLERIHGAGGMELRWWPVGGTLALNCGGAPKLLLAYQSEQEIARALSGPLPTLTAKSITDRAKLREHLARVHEQGYEFAVDDVALGLAALAVPVLDAKGRLLCAVSVSTLNPQMIDHGRPKHLARLLAAAEAIRRRLGMKAETPALETA